MIIVIHNTVNVIDNILNIIYMSIVRINVIQTLLIYCTYTSTYEQMFSNLKHYSEPDHLGTMALWSFSIIH